MTLLLHFEGKKGVVGETLVSPTGACPKARDFFGARYFHERSRSEVALPAPRLDAISSSGLVAEPRDRGTRALGGREDVLGGRARLSEPEFSTTCKSTPAAFAIAAAVSRARRSGLARTASSSTAPRSSSQFPCLLPPACAQRTQRVGIAGVGMRMTNEIEAS